MTIMDELEVAELRAEVERLTRERDLWKLTFEKECQEGDKAWSEVHAKWKGRALAAEAKVSRLERALDEARGALSDLYDVQNGPPLITYTDDWNAAMERAAKVLGFEERKP